MTRSDPTTPPPGTPEARLDAVSDFSLVLGGPFFHALVRAGFVRLPSDFLTRRIVAVVLVAWVPPYLLSVWAGRVIEGPGIPFLLDIGAHARILATIPLLLAAETIVHRRGAITVRQFLERDLIAPEDLPKFDEAIASAMRLRNSLAAELAALAVSIVVGFAFATRYLVPGSQTWFADVEGGRAEPTAAGIWYVYVSLTIFRFLLARWYLRLFIWSRFLWQVARKIPLRLNALHPDRCGGLGFLTSGLFAFQPVLLAHAASLSGVLGGKILHEGAELPQFKLEIVAWIGAMTVFVLAPLCFFVAQLAAAKRAGLRSYGSLGSRYTAEFRRKWMGEKPGGEPLLGTADLQSLADLANSFAVVQEMRVIPFGRQTVVQIASITALPLAPLILTMVPLDQLLDRVIEMFV